MGVVSQATVSQATVSQATLMQVKRRAVSRLTELGLTVSMVERVVRRADAEASICTEFDPPIIAGLTRWGRATRFLREELVPLGWTYDNPRLLARTIHPGGEFAIVVATGDQQTGIAGGMPPTTKHRKGDATVEAVQVNGQIAFDFGSSWELDGVDDGLLTWLLLFYVDENEFRSELSLPNQIQDGWITGWAERIILPAFPRAAEPLFDYPAGPDADGPDGPGGEQVVVDVSRR
jgi:hypothetical protein